MNDINIHFNYAFIVVLSVLHILYYGTYTIVHRVLAKPLHMHNKYNRG